MESVRSRIEQYDWAGYHIGRDIQGRIGGYADECAEHMIRDIQRLVRDELGHHVEAHMRDQLSDAG